MQSPHFSYLEYATAYNKPFVCYRLPWEAESVTLILNENSAKAFENFDEIENQKGFVFVPFLAKNHTKLFISPEEILFGNKGFRGDLFLDKNRGKSYSKLTRNIESKENYTSEFSQFFKLLEKKELEKVILSRTITITDFPKEEQPYLFYNLWENYPNAMVYWVYLPHLGVEWMGATPELLLEKKGCDLHTMALAGTKKEEENWSEKERVEHQMVVDYINSVLSKYEPIVSKTTTIDTGTVQHLQTCFCLENTASEFFTIMEKLHPTPAVCGLPRGLAFEQIAEIEKHERAYYCGFLGVLGLAEKYVSYVNLRSMELAENSVRLYVGGGLTKDSDLEKEWSETERKATTLLQFIE